MLDSFHLIARVLAEADRPCLTSSFQIDGVVLIDLVRQIRPDIPILFVDTCHHFAETLAYRDRLAARWDLRVVTLRAREPSPGDWSRDAAACCARHKVEPLFDALGAYDLWLTALRRDQSPSRATLREVDSARLPSGHVLRKASPLAGWTERDVQRYARAHALPLHPLYERGFRSIGCAPCTAVPPDPADPRSGRWNGERLECGIHLHAVGS